MTVLKDRDGDLWFPYLDGFVLIGEDDPTDEETIDRIWGPVTEGTIVFEESK